jgi:NAD(P)-dependent dehydrogenase (short-subunit alcohol dehydrogenase family)
MTELAGKVAIVTGGSAGIGLGVALRLTKEGARVVLADIDEVAGRQAVSALGADTSFWHTDVADQQHLRDLVDHVATTFGRLDIMINNAGIGGANHPRLLDDDLSDFHQVMGIDLLGVMAGTREAARVMKDNGGGSIVNISSIGGMNPSSGNWTYHVAKSSVIMFTKCAAIDLGEHNIRVNAIAPGNIETDILGRNQGAGVADEKRAEFTAAVRQFIISRQPLKLQGHVEDIAQAVLFFVTDRSRYVTGTLLPVDAGLSAGVPRSAGGIEALRKQAEGESLISGAA